MKRLFAVALCLGLLLAGCATPSGYMPTEMENVSIRIEDVTPTGATILIHDQNPQPYVYGKWFQLETEKDGTWYELPTVIQNYGFEEIGLLPNAAGDLTMETDWEWLYGRLSAGHYRLLKQVDRHFIAVEFTI